MSDSKRSMPLSRRAMVGALSAMLVACGSAPVSRALVIIPSAPAPVDAGTSASSPSARPLPAAEVGVLTIKLPEHWQRRGVLHLRGDSELQTWPNAIWAERVEIGMTRRLSQALRQRAPELGWWPSDDSQAPRRLQVDVQQLDVMAQRGQIASVLQWRLIDRQGRVTASGSLRRQVDEPIQGPQDEAQALGRWLDTVALALGEAVRGVSDSADKTTGLR